MTKKIIAISAMAIVIFSCKGKVSVTGAGSTFLYPAISNWADMYKKANKVNINYQPIGSGGGISQFLKKTVKFAGTDKPVSLQYLNEHPDILHLPIIVGGVVVAYNLGTSAVQKLRLTPHVLSDIFLGKIKKWNDKRLQEINNEMNLPDKNIIVVYRADGSGTTYVFTKYLSDVSNEWKEQVGSGTSVNWPCGIGARGNEGVAGTLKNLPFTIGYIELSYAKHENIPYALIQNRSGNFIEPSLESFTSSVYIPSNIRKDRLFYDLVNTQSAEGYPITSFSYILVWKQYEEEDCSPIYELLKFLKWCNSSQAQEYVTKFDYAKLPAAIVKLNLEILDSITCAGRKNNDG